MHSDETKVMEESTDAVQEAALSPETTEASVPESDQTTAEEALIRKIMVGCAAAALLACCTVFSLLYLLSAEGTSRQMVSARTTMEPMETPPPPTTEPPTEPTEPPTEEPSYEMQLSLDTANSYHASNPDVVGWIYIDDTVIDYPIVQGTDNSFYIDHNWRKQYSHSGSIFQDYACDLTKSENTLIYGHNLANGTMFHAIKKYKSEEWGLEHPFVEVSTLNTRYLYRVLSVNVLYGDYGTSFEYWNCKDMDRESYTEFVQKIYDTSLVWYGGEELPEFGTKILTLQTCNSGANDGMRCVLFAERVAIQ